MKVGVIGAGNVGAAAAFAMVLRGSASEVVLIDRNQRLAEAQARDILHSTPFARANRIAAGGYPDLSGAEVVILAAGVNQKPGETRLALLERNAAVFAEIVPAVLQHCAPILLVATNPVDVMTWITAKLSGAPRARVIGSGTLLDSARFRALLGAHLGVAAQSVHAYVLGEHGDSEVLCWSAASVGGIPIAALAQQLRHPIDTDLRRRIDDEVRRAAYLIIEGKGATWFGIAAALARIVEAIGADEHALLTLTACEGSVEGVPNVALSLPRIIGGAGIVHTLDPRLDDEERGALRHSAQTIGDIVGQLRLAAR